MSGPTKKLGPDQLLALLEVAIRDAPKLTYNVALSEQDLRWLGRAEALLEASQSLTDLTAFRLARRHLNTYAHSRDALVGALINAFYRVELQAPIDSRGSFIPAGDTWNGYAALVRLLERDCDDLLLVDPYLNATLFTDFAPHAAARKAVRCLTTKRSENDPGLVAAAQKWATDKIGQKTPVEVRYAAAGALHDRLIIFDGAEAWLVTQSLKDIAKRSPASVSRAEAEISALKAEHYNALWNGAAPVC